MVHMARVVRSTWVSVEDDGGVRGAGKGDGDRRQPLLHQLPHPQQVRALGEEQHHGGETQHRLGADGAHPPDPEHRVLDRDGHQALHLVGGEAGRLGLDLDQRRGELGEDVERRLPQDAGREQDQQQRERHHRDPVAQGHPDERPHHFAGPNSVLNSSIAPMRTTRAPTGGPRRSTATSPTTCSTSTRRRTKTSESVRS